MIMISILKTWFHRYFSHPEAGVLFFLIVATLFVIYTMSSMLAPVFASLIIAYLLEGMISRLERFHIKRWVAVLMVFCFFIGILAVLVVFLVPLLWEQTANLLTALPEMVGRGQHFILQLQQRYPQIFTAAQISASMSAVRDGIAHYGQVALSISLASIPTVITLVIYLVLVPLLIYFFLMDRDQLLRWFNRCLPRHRGALDHIWAEAHLQLGNYVRGKVVEIIIVSVVSYIAFAILHLQYALLVAFAVGLSVLIPYIGALVVTIPVLIIGFVQWGWSGHFAWLIAVYATIITLDANVLVPLLFSEAVDLHPVAIIAAVLFFGAIWGFWGVFFAIPLASLVKAILRSWPIAETP
jgi:putative permease